MGPFGCLTELGAKRAELVQKFVPRSRIKFFRNERTRWTPLDPKLTFWCISSYLGAFGTVWLAYELDAKQAELVQKFVTRSRVGIFRYERTQSTPLDPILTYWCVPYYSDAFGTVWLPYKTRNFSQRTHPIHHIGPQTDVLVRFVLFGCIGDHLVALRNSVQNGPN